MPVGKTAKGAQGRTDWDRLRATPEADIERRAIADPDNPATVADAEWAEAFVGAPPVKCSVHATFDSDVLEFFMRDGRGYQTRMNAVLRSYMEAQRAKKVGS